MKVYQSLSALSLLVACAVLGADLSSDDPFAFLAKGHQEKETAGDGDGEPKVKGSNDATTFMRALYSDEPDRCNDTLARLFLEGSRRTMVDTEWVRKSLRGVISGASQYNTVFFSARSNFLDTVVEEAVRERGIRQVVSLAAGFETRAHRLFSAEGDKEILSEVKFFEVDFPIVMKEKEREVRALGLPNIEAVRWVGADLAVGFPSSLLQEASLDLEKPTVVILEGLLYYLEQNAAEGLLGSISNALPEGSVVSYDFANQCLFRRSCPHLAPVLVDIFLTYAKAIGEPWQSGWKGPYEEDGAWEKFDESDHRALLEGKGMDLRRLISFHDATGELGVVSWKASPVFSQMNFVVAQVSSSHGGGHISEQAEAGEGGEGRGGGGRPTGRGGSSEDSVVIV